MPPPSTPVPKDKQRAASPAKPDGRSVRSANTRQAVAEAYLHLVEGGQLRPTARAIAAVAGVSERAVFRHFQDMETLHAEAAVLQIQRVGPLLPQPAPASGPLANRASLLAHRWGTLNEEVSPVRRVALLHEPFSREIARRLAWVRRLARSEIEATFAAELAAQDEDLRRRTLAALAAALSWETWNEFRIRHGLDGAGSEHTVAATMVAVLTSFAKN